MISNRCKYFSQKLKLFRHSFWKFQNFSADNCQESRWAGKHHVLHDAFRSTATCRRGSSLFFFLICQITEIRIPKFLETLQDFVPLFSRNSQNCSKKSPNSKTIPSQLWQNNDKYLPLKHFNIRHPVSHWSRDKASTFCKYFEQDT